MATRLFFLNYNQGSVTVTVNLLPAVAGQVIFLETFDFAIYYVDFGNTSIDPSGGIGGNVTLRDTTAVQIWQRACWRFQITNVETYPIPPVPIPMNLMCPVGVGLELRFAFVGLGPFGIFGSCAGYGALLTP